MFRLLPLIAQRSFSASVPSFNILLGYIENLKALKLDLKTLTHISEILMRELDSNIQNSLHGFENIPVPLLFEIL